MIANVINYLKNLQNQNDELLWAKIWEDTKRGISWLDELPGISPGRWAVGYNYLFVMSKILDYKEPESVLDLGLGISSTLISCYFKNKLVGIHTIVEHDKEWIDFYTKKEKVLSPNSEIIILDYVDRIYKNHKYIAYKNFENTFKNKKYSVISIDAPWGSDRYSRRDIVELIPDILEQDFTIIIDDANRRGEKDTISEIKNVLTKNRINHHSAIYPGMSHICVLTSEKNKFLCSL